MNGRAGRMVRLARGEESPAKCGEVPQWFSRALTANQKTLGKKDLCKRALFPDKDFEPTALPSSHRSDSHGEPNAKQHILEPATAVRGSKPAPKQQRIALQQINHNPLGLAHNARKQPVKRSAAEAVCAATPRPSPAKKIVCQRGDAAVGLARKAVKLADKPSPHRAVCAATPRPSPARKIVCQRGDTAVGLEPRDLAEETHVEKVERWLLDVERSPAAERNNQTPHQTAFAAAQQQPPEQEPLSLEPIILPSHARQGLPGSILSVHETEIVTKNDDKASVDNNFVGDNLNELQTNSTMCSKPTNAANIVTVEFNEGSIQTDFFIEAQEEVQQGDQEDVQLAQGLVTPAPTKKQTRVDAPRKNVKKRVLNPNTWKINEAKTALNQGKAHISSKTGKVRPERVMGPGCQEKCNRCKQRLTYDERSKIKETFWELGNHQRQLDYILSRIKSVTPTKKYAAPGNKGVSNIRIYSFKFEGKEIRVCKKTFMDTLVICDSWIKTATSNSRGEPGFAPPDRRGKHNNRPQRTANEVKESVRTHINKIPRIESHYTRERTKREYIEGGLSIDELYRRYLLWCEGEHITPASDRIYRKIFNEEFNIGQFKPKKDQCLICTKWKRSTTQEKAEMAHKYAVHRQNRRISRGYKTAGREKAQSGTNPKFCCCSFDLQKVLLCPRSEVGSAFYESRLSIYNFTMFDMGPKLGECFLWNETQARKSSLEVSSCVCKFIEDRSSKGFDEFEFYSDNPTSQNKNRFIFGMYLYACVKFGVKIVHRYLEVGHTHMEVDSMHASIEKAVFRKEIMDQDEWCSYILQAKKCGKTRNDPVEKYNINKIGEDVHILDFKELVALQNWDFDTSKKKINWLNVREISFDPTTPQLVGIKYEYEGGTITLNVNQKRGRPVNLKTYRPSNAYKSLFPLAANKVKGLKNLMKWGAIPNQYHGFYNELFDIGEVDGAVGCPSDCEDCEAPDDPNDVPQETTYVPEEIE